VSSPPGTSLRAFKRVYYSAVALSLAASACLPVVVPLSFPVLGFDPSVRNADTVESFQAYRVTAPFRRGFGYGVILLAGIVVAVSMAALILRVRRKIDIPWGIPIGAMRVAVLVAVLVFAGLMAPVGICC
jgi:hypothetical protein